MYAFRVLELCNVSGLGCFERLLGPVAGEPDLEWLMIDAGCIHAHPFLEHRASNWKWLPEAQTIALHRHAKTTILAECKIAAIMSWMYQFRGILKLMARRKKESYL